MREGLALRIIDSQIIGHEGAGRAGPAPKPPWLPGLHEGVWFMSANISPAVAVLPDCVLRLCTV